MEERSIATHVGVAKVPEAAAGGAGEALQPEEDLRMRP